MHNILHVMPVMKSLVVFFMRGFTRSVPLNPADFFMDVARSIFSVDAPRGFRNKRY